MAEPATEDKSSESFREQIKNIVFGKPHHDDAVADMIIFTTVPRYKTSGLSGDEWRTSVRVGFFKKVHNRIKYPIVLRAKPVSFTEYIR